MSDVQYIPDGVGGVWPVQTMPVQGNPFKLDPMLPSGVEEHPFNDEPTQAQMERDAVLPDGPKGDTRLRVTSTEADEDG